MFEVSQVVDIPVIGIGGVATIDDTLDLLAAGASAVGVGVAALADPMLPVRLGDELADACRARGLEDVRGLVGTALPAKPSTPSTRGAEYADEPAAPLADRHQRRHGHRVRVRQARGAARGPSRARADVVDPCLLGGVLGAWVVFFGMRHKTQKQAFWVVQSAASVLWVVLIVAVVTR